MLDKCLGYVSIFSFWEGSEALCTHETFRVVQLPVAVHNLGLGLEAEPAAGADHALHVRGGRGAHGGRGQVPAQRCHLSHNEHCSTVEVR